MRIIIEFDGGAGDMPGAPERVAISDTREAKLVRRILDVIGKYDRGEGVLKKDVSNGTGGYRSCAGERNEILTELEDYGIIVRDARFPNRMKLNRRWRYDE